MAGKADKRKDSKWSWKDFLPVIMAIPMAILVKISIFTTYHVPTASMVPTIIPGDHIVVEKWVFGSRLFINNKTYRLPGWRSIGRGDVLVFNVPKEDSIFSLHREVNFYNWKHSKAAAKLNEKTKDSFMYMPVPGRTPFVKRVIGLPGDQIQYNNHTLLLNNQPVMQFQKSVQYYELRFGNTFDYENYKDTLYRLGEHIQMNHADKTIKGIFEDQELQFLNSSLIRMSPIIHFPDKKQIPEDFTWARKLVSSKKSLKIPSKGWTVRVDSAFLHQYGQILKRFEGFKGSIKDLTLIDTRGNHLTEYTFRQNYYWAMGDNRPYSEDSRAWGLIPEDHVIGITRRIFWSKAPGTEFSDGFRWNRLWRSL